ncbi:MAG: glycosyltransferase family 39 protein [Chloroflexota bacterium]|nr:glycosyltransferase family 39 protein [Chloroflexota bacterium]
MTSPMPAPTLDQTGLDRATTPTRAAGTSGVKRALPWLIAFVAFVVFMLTATGFHTYDGISYIRDMGKPLAALFLPHHLIYEPSVLLMLNLWRALGYTGYADLPGSMFSSIAGAGGLGLFFGMARHASGSTLVAIVATLMLGLTYGYWFYSVEVDIYVQPLFFLLATAWLYLHALRSTVPSTYMFLLMGMAHALGALYHQAALFTVPAFALGIYLLPGKTGEKVRRVVAYGATLGLVLVPAYFIGGVLIAGQDTPDKFVRWANNFGQLGTWGAFTPATLTGTISGTSAAISADYWIGRLLLLSLVVVLAARARSATRRGGPLAWVLWTWVGTYTLFFIWWQPEVLKFWVLVLPPTLLLVVLGFHWGALGARRRTVAWGMAAAVLLLLTATNAPSIWAKRDPMSDPGRRTSAELSRISGREDLIILQSGSAEHYLPFMYDRINVMSARELWYQGGASGQDEAVTAIRRRLWHALAKGSSVWIEDRVLTPGVRISDHYVFSREEIDVLLSPYGDRVEGTQVAAGSASFTRISPNEVYSKADSWTFATDEQGWSAANVAGETVGEQGWCFSPREDPSLYSPPLRLQTSGYGTVYIVVDSAAPGRAQLFFRQNPEEPYNEESSVGFQVEPGTHSYEVPLGPEWRRMESVQGLRLDPVESGDPSAGEANRVCIKEIRLQP